MNAAMTVRVSHRYTASPERVFDAWLDPESAKKWLFATATGEMVRAEIDPRVGGKFVFTDRRDGEDIEHVGEYLELTRPHRLVFTFSVPKFSPVVTRVTIEIVPLDSGCELTLIHEGVLPEYAEGTQGGWTKILNSLGMLGSEANYGKVVAADTVRIERLLPGPIERVWAYLTESEKRGRWLASGEMDLRVGGKVRLNFLHSSLTPHQEPPPERFKEYDCGVGFDGVVTRCEPPRLLSYTWVGGSEVTFELVPQDAKVLLVITHVRLRGSDEMANVAAGWHTHVAIMEQNLLGITPGPFWSIWQRLETEYKRRMAQ